ncbi:laccase-11-like [Elaeis guineensis]|uniref:laccase-11-like n=1 Tax=Elaeis guineensis var. tenera TaxID=51953 RepID=UPI003C6D3ECD
MYGATVIMPKDGVPHHSHNLMEKLSFSEGNCGMRMLKRLRCNMLGLLPNKSDAHTINGKLGPLFPCSEKHTFAMEVEWGISSRQPVDGIVPNLLE